jgi:hypothetical protein
VHGELIEHHHAQLVFDGLRGEAAFRRPSIERIAGELRPAVAHDARWEAKRRRESFEHWMTHSASGEWPTLIVGDSRVKSSARVKQRNGRPPARVSLPQSVDQRSFGPLGTGSGTHGAATRFFARGRLIASSTSR